MTKHKRPRGYRVAVWVAGVVAATVIGLGITGAANSVLKHFRHTARPISEQIAAIQRRIARSGFEQTYLARADLHGNGQTSLIVVSKPRTYPPGPWAPSSVLQIYDLKANGDLTRVFDFRPTQTVHYPGDSHPVHLGYDVRVNGVRDFSKSGANVLVLDLEALYGDGEESHPAVVYWDSVRQQYETRALLSREAPQIVSKDYKRYYGSLARITNARGPAPIVHSYGTEAFVLFPADGHPVMLAAYIVAATAHCCPTKYEVIAQQWFGRIQDTEPPEQCFGAKGPFHHVVLPFTSRTHTWSAALMSAWNTHRSDFSNC